MDQNLTLHTVSHTFGKVTLFDKVNLTFKQGTSYALQGVSGTGKSTLLYILAGLLKPTMGSVSLNDKPLMFMDQKILRDTFGIIFQFPYLMPELTVCENVMMKGLITGNDVECSQKEALILLEDAGLRSHANVWPSTLSGGEAQRVSVLRAIYNKPAFLLADEPTAHLDSDNRTIVLDLIKRYQQEYGMGVIVTTHDPIVAEAMDCVYTIHDHHVIGVSC